MLTFDKRIMWFDTRKSDLKRTDVFLFLCLLLREDQVNFRGFMRTLAHFRPIEDNEKNKNSSASEPLNSRTNKLLCESAAQSQGCDQYQEYSQDFRT